MNQNLFLFCAFLAAVSSATIAVVAVIAALKLRETLALLDAAIVRLSPLAETVVVSVGKISSTAAELSSLLPALGSALNGVEKARPPNWLTGAARAMSLIAAVRTAWVSKPPSYTNSRENNT
jgi:hypothetical protein